MEQSSITGVGFRPDLLWIKQEDTCYTCHMLFELAEV